MIYAAKEQIDMLVKPLQVLELDDIQIFCRAAESNSFTEASISLDVTPSAVSKAVNRLEKKLKIKLFLRSTRSMRLTEEGKSYYSICRESLENIQMIEQQLLDSSVPRGVLKISLPDSLAINYLTPALNGFIEKYIETLKVEVFLSTTFVDFIREDMDLALRIGNISDLNLVAKPFSKTKQKIVTSPAYLKKYGRPKTLEDLTHHHCIGMKFPGMAHPMSWIFKDGQELDLNFAMLYDSPMGAIQTVKNGFGILQILDFSIEEDLKNGALIELFAEHRPDPIDIHIVYPGGSRYIPAKVRAFIDYLVQHNALYKEK